MRTLRYSGVQCSVRARSRRSCCACKECRLSDRVARFCSTDQRSYCIASLVSLDLQKNADGCIAYAKYKFSAREASEHNIYHAPDVRPAG